MRACVLLCKILGKPALNLAELMPTAVDFPPYFKGFPYFDGLLEGKSLGQ